jgi:hypothetical protein
MSMPGGEASESELREGLTAILRATPPLMRVLSVARRTGQYSPKTAYRKNLRGLIIAPALFMWNVEKT